MGALPYRFAVPEANCAGRPWFWQTGSTFDQARRCRRNLPEKPDYFVHETERWLVFPHELSGLAPEEIARHNSFASEFLPQADAAGAR
jgi:hypothetical protein